MPLPGLVPNRVVSSAFPSPSVSRNARTPLPRIGRRRTHRRWAQPQYPALWQARPSASWRRRPPARRSHQADSGRRRRHRRSGELPSPKPRSHGMPGRDRSPQGRQATAHHRSEQGHHGQKSRLDAHETSSIDTASQQREACAPKPSAPNAAALLTGGARRKIKLAEAEDELRFQMVTACDM